MLKVHSVGYNAASEYTGRLAVVASQICKISRNSQKIRTYSSSRSSILVPIENVYAISY